MHINHYSGQFEAMPQRRARRIVRSRLLVAGLTLSLIATLSACGLLASNTRSVVVNVLWVSSSDGTESGGVAPLTISATVAPRESDTQAFDVDLNEVEDENVGAQWLATSATAATTGTLLSGSNPSDVQLTFDIDATINGSSAGALMAVGVIAAIRGDSITTDKTLTGTLNPDGSIGHVSGVAAKIRAAAEAGYSEVLIPSVTGDVPDSTTGTSVDPVTLGKSVGTTVTKVPTVTDAYQSLTGHQLLDPTAKTPPLDSTLVSAVGQQAAELQDELRSSLNRPPSKSTALPTQALTAARKCLNSGTQLLNTKKYVSAYSTLWLCLRTYKSAIARSQITVTTTKSDSKHSRSKIQARLAKQARLLEAQAQAAVTRVPADQELSPAGVVGNASSLNWPIWTQSELATYATILEDQATQSASSLADYAGSISDAQFNLTTSFPDTQQILKAWPNSLFSPPTTSNPGTQFNNAQDAQDYFLGYSSFLNQAADANLAYFESVVAGVTDESTQKELRTANTFYNTATNLKTQSTGNSDSPLVQLATASTYYLASSALVSAQSAFGAASTSGAGDIAVSTREALQASLDTSAASVDSLAAHITEARMDPSYALWQKDWGVDVNKSKTHNQRTNEALTGLTGVWQSALQLRMLDSLTQQ